MYKTAFRLISEPKFASPQINKFPGVAKPRNPYPPNSKAAYSD